MMRGNGGIFSAAALKNTRVDKALEGRSEEGGGAK